MKRPSGRTDGQERTFEAGNRLRVHPQTVSSPALSKKRRKTPEFIRGDIRRKGCWTCKFVLKLR